MEALLALIIFFRQAAAYLSGNTGLGELLGGNLDPFFLLGLGGLYFIFRTNKIAYYLAITLPVLLLAPLQIIAIDNIDIVGLMVNSTKIMLCIATLILVHDTWRKIDFDKVASGVSVLSGIFTVLALLLPKTTVFWTLNDEVNIFDQERLKLFFLEPSELGFTLMITIYFLVRALRATSDYSKRIFYSICILSNLFVLSIARPLGAIAIGLIALAIGIIYHLILKKGLRPKFWAICIASFVLMLSTAFTITNSPLMRIDNTLVQRSLYVLQGYDGSVNYRTNVSYDVALDAYLRSPIIGHGMGYTSSEAFIRGYEAVGLRTQIVNSYLSFIVETGIFGLLAICLLLYLLLRSALLSKSSLIVTLTIFLVVYQFSGGHFTNPFVWALYGIILGMASKDGCQKRAEENLNA